MTIHIGAKKGEIAELEWVQNARPIEVVAGRPR